jgi:hypothetical protein
VAPAHSEPLKSPRIPLRSPASTTWFSAKRKISPSGVRPCSDWTGFSPSSHSTRPPRGLTAMLSGLSSTSGPGEAKTQVSVCCTGSSANTWPSPAAPPDVELK